MSKVLKDFFIWLLGILLIGCLGYYIRLIMIEKTAEHFLAKTQKIQENIQEQQKVNQQAEALNKEREYLIRKEKSHEARKEYVFNKAFYSWYVEPQGCNNWTSDSHMVECINHKMKAKETFKSLYQGN